MVTAKPRLVRCWLLLLATAALLLVPTATPAHAADSVTSYVAEANVAQDGALRVRATITPDAAGGDLVQRFATTLETTGNRSFEFRISDVKATRGGADAGATVRHDAGYDIVTVPLTSADPVVLEYTVVGAALDSDAGTTVVWRLLQGLNMPVQTFDATVHAPVPFTMIDCEAGPPAAPGACGWYQGGTHDVPDPTFHDGPRGAGEVVQVTLRFAPGSVTPNQILTHHWTLDRAFSLDPLPLGLAALVALAGLGGLYLLSHRLRREPSPDITPTLVGTFRPVGPGHSEFEISDGIRPGQVGTLMDGRADPVDVTATLVDLAVHGSFLIRELPRGRFEQGDWEFVTRDAADRELRPYEKTLVEALAPVDGVPARVSQLAARVADVLPTLQGQLYDDVVERGWYGRRPDAHQASTATNAWIGLGVAAVIAALLIALTPFGLLGLVLVALAAGFGWVLQDAPARTQDGTKVMEGLDILRGQLLTQPTDEMPADKAELELSEVLPYAIVLGGLGRWLDGLAATDTDPDPDETDLFWYHGPEGWQLSDLPESLRHFITTVEGRLLER
ncbi:DUF2207 domain-containing protein [Propioniciclava coleopterorum]|uniref:DUF2207 domain-containing protein n=1 Tax=Propioniciclava coleopterorum TaxID=2714937 RepID=A0A6G7Y4W5_9ACTN|nr:DUF2207 domain-containing protein [Propioniciclava coleopterorum]QIK71706.1 DUF2207 domain-containing protein [Propioniciclava coleopterorum]